MSSRCLSGQLLLALAGVVALAGCGQIPLDDKAPERFDLSGYWVQADNPQQPGGYGDRAPGDVPRPSRAGTDPDSMASGFMAQDFPLLVAEHMRIEQDARSMGIEYARGSYRDVSWGERRRGVWEVRAGWHEGALHIYTHASDISAAEVWRLSEDGQRLDISISVKGHRDRNFHRVFRRASAL